MKQALERSVFAVEFRKAYESGEFLMVSGISFEVDCSKQTQAINPDATAIITPGERVSNIIIAGKPFDPDATYKVVITTFLANLTSFGNDGYVPLLNAKIIEVDKSVVEKDVLVEYIRKQSTVAPKVEGRIKLAVNCTM